MGSCLSVCKKCVQPTFAMSKGNQDVKASSMSESERLKKQLNSYGRQVVLEQSLRILDSNDDILKGVFAKILLASKRFYWTAKHRQVYCFGMIIQPERTIFGCLSYQKDTFYEFEINFEKASKLIRFLQPNHTYFVVNLKDNETSEFLQLVPLANGSLHFKFTDKLDVASQLVESNWSKIDELICHISALPRNVAPKSFEFLSVRGIETIDELKEALRHNSKELSLKFNPNLLNDDDEPIHEVGNIKTCILFGHTTPFLQVARIIVASCPTLKQLNFNSLFKIEDTEELTTDELIGNIIQRYNVYNQINQFSSQSGIKSTINIFKKYSGNNFLLQQDWMNPLLTHPEFNQIKYKTETVDGKVVTTFTDEHKSDKMEAKFHIELTYQYPEVPVVANEV